MAIGHGGLCLLPMSLKHFLIVSLAGSIACSSPMWADTLVLTPTDDSYIRASQSNQGENTLVIIGDTATANDYLRGAFAFDLSGSVLTGATISSVTLTLTIDTRDTSNGGSSSAVNTIDLHELSASFTNNGITWTSRDGSNPWSTAGGDFGGVLTSLISNAGSVNTGDKLNFSSTALMAAAEAARGGTLPLLGKLQNEDANRSVFRIASANHSNPSYRPVLTIEYQAFVSDPNLSQDILSGDPDLQFGTITGDPPASATRTLRFVNEGPNNPITIESAQITGSGVFTINDLALNDGGGQTLPLTLQVGDALALKVAASSSDYLPLAEATLILDTNDNLQDREFALSVSFPEPGSAMAHPAIPGTPASSAYQVRVDGVPVAVNDESYFDFHTAFFSIEEPAMVEVEFSPGVSYTSIHPLRHGIQPTINGNTISFPMLEPHKLVIKASGALPLALCATPNEENIPASGDPDVLYFGPGTHEPGLIEPVSGQTVYLASGALVKGRIEVRDATGVTIRGRGTLDARGYSVRGDKTHAILFEGCNDVHIEGIGIRGGTWWQTLFLLTNDASAIHLSLFGVSVNTDGIDIDGVQRFVARDCFIRCEDDGFGWHVLDAETNGEPPTRDCLAEDCVIWNTRYGNGLRVGASMETELFENITFRDIDVLEHAGAAIYADHSDWATCRNIRFENFTDETTKQTVNMYIDKTRYSNATGYRDERGHYDGLHFVNLNSPGGGIRLAGYDAGHLIDQVSFTNSKTGSSWIDGPEDITTNAFVTNVTFSVDPPVFEARAIKLSPSVAGWIQLGFSSIRDEAYSILASDDLGITDPFSVIGNTTGNGDATSILLYDSGAAGKQRRFYRIRKD